MQFKKLQLVKKTIEYLLILQFKNLITNLVCLLNE